MSEFKIVGYKKIFGLILPDWVSEKILKSFIFGLFTSGVMLLVFIFVVRPKFELVKEMRLGLEKDRLALEALKKSRDGINKLKTDLNEGDQAKVLASVPLYYSPDQAIFVLRYIAQQTGASIVSYSLPAGVLLDNNEKEVLGNKGEMVSFAFYPVKLVVAAPVDVLLRFIAKVENSLPYGAVSDLNLQEVTKLTKDSVNKNVQITLEIKYYQAKINKININKIASISDDNIEFASKLSGFDDIAKNINLNTSFESGLLEASASGDIFGF